MIFQTQLFSIANLIFSSNQNSHFSVTSEEITVIQTRFQEIVSFFNTSEKDYNSGFIKNNKSQLPYNSFSIIGNLNDHLILHFTYSFNNPILFIIDSEKNSIRNFIDICQAKDILNDDVFLNLKGTLTYPRYTNNRFKGVTDINLLVEMYQNKMEQYNNPKSITGRDCFEIGIEELGA